MSQVHMGFLIDESGSMSTMQESVVNGYNEFVSTLIKEGDSEKVSATLGFFDSYGNDDHVRFKFNNVPLNELPELSKSDFNPRGMTPLNDALSITIKKIDKNVNSDDRVMVIVMTDGAENASELSGGDLRELVKSKEKQGWEFIYLGANVDSFSEAQKSGIDTANANSYAGSVRGTSNAMKRAGTRSALFTKSPEAYLTTKSLASSFSIIPEDDFSFDTDDSILKEAQEKALQLVGGK